MQLKLHVNVFAKLLPDVSNSSVLEIRLYFCLLVFGFNVPSIMDYYTEEITIEEVWPWLLGSVD